MGIYHWFIVKKIKALNIELEILKIEFKSFKKQYISENKQVDSSLQGSWTQSNDKTDRFFNHLSDPRSESLPNRSQIGQSDELQKNHRFKKFFDEFKKSEFANFLKKHFAENLIGILGTLAVVLGVIFLGVYAAIQTNPVGRFAIICSFSMAFYLAYLF